MPDYSRGKIYIMTSELLGKSYVGSTTKEYLSQRLTQHKTDHSRGIKKGSYDIIAAGDYVITLLELYPCTCKDELHAREQHYMDLYDGTLSNKIDAVASPIKKAERAVIYHKKYYDTHTEIIKSKVKAYVEENKEVVLAKKQVYRDTHREALKESGRMHWAANKDAINEKRRANRAAKKLAAHTI